MKSKFDWDQFRDDVTKLRFKALGVIIVILIIVFAGSLITGKNLFSSGENSGSSAPVTSENTQADNTDSETETSTSAASTGKTSATTTEKTTTAKVASTENKYNEYHFRSKSQLNQHFDKQGGEFKKDFGYKNADEYEKGASDVINNPKALCKTEKEDSDYVYYIEETNEFVVLSTDGYIRTYFRPNAGIDYFNRQ